MAMRRVQTGGSVWRNASGSAPHHRVVAGPTAAAVVVASVHPSVTRFGTTAQHHRVHAGSVPRTYGTLMSGPRTSIPSATTTPLTSSITVRGNRTPGMWPTTTCVSSTRTINRSMMPMHQTRSASSTAVQALVSSFEDKLETLTGERKDFQESVDSFLQKHKYQMTKEKDSIKLTKPNITIWLKSSQENHDDHDQEESAEPASGADEEATEDDSSSKDDVDIIVEINKGDDKFTLHAWTSDGTSYDIEKIEVNGHTAYTEGGKDGEAEVKQFKKYLAEACALEEPEFPKFVMAAADLDDVTTEITFSTALVEFMRKK
eukprot:TRINITY_DN1216_c0_g1_i1.p1 TRINITY_DN1216_c0_g1~~TRINITY_DN1216_c0_g1_i1.p1  ORF type:complete len:317 (-),score=64.57 TRINITY_DN1216_c0_g1_i1:70-1020(-)